MTDVQRRPWPAGARVVDAAMFRLLLDMEVQKARRLRYCLSLVCFTGELVAAASNEASDPLAEIISRRIRSTDVATVRGPGAVAFLLIDADVTTLPTILRRIALDFETPAWSAGASSFPKSASNPDELLEQAASMMTAAGGSGGGRLRLQP
jgi:hypothetical protein